MAILVFCAGHSMTLLLLQLQQLVVLLCRKNHQKPKGKANDILSNICLLRNGNQLATLPTTNPIQSQQLRKEGLFDRHGAILCRRRQCTIYLKAVPLLGHHCNTHKFNNTVAQTSKVSFGWFTTTQPGNADHVDDKCRAIERNLQLHLTFSSGRNSINSSTYPRQSHHHHSKPQKV